MPIRKTKSGIGIELTGDRINLVKLTETPQGIVLARARSIKFPTGKKEEDKKLLISSVVKAFEGIDFTKDEISLGVGGHMSFVRKVKLPPVSQAKLKQVVSFEAQQQVPFSLSEVIWDYQIISPVSKVPAPVIVLIAAIKQSFVEDLLKILQSSINKTPELVDISSLALHNCLIFNDSLPKEKVGILVNLEFSYTDVSIENKGEMAFTRAVPIGRRNLLKKIADARGVGIEKAEEILEREDVSSIVLSIWEDLIAEIKRTTNYYLSQVEKVTHFQYIYLAGEFQKNSNLPALLKDSFRVEVEEINPLKKIGYDPVQLTNGSSSFCVSTGLALRALTHFPVEMNLLPHRILSKRKIAIKRPYFISSFVVLFLIGWTLLVLGTRSYNLTSEKIKMIEPILNSSKPYADKAERLKSEEQGIISKLQNIEGILKHKSQLSEILLEISKLTPSHIYITEISTTTSTSTAGVVVAPAARIPNRSVPSRRATTEEEDSAMPTEMGAEVQVSGGVNTEFLGFTISLSGITVSYPSVDEYIKQLKTSPLFKTVELASVLSTLQEEQGTQPETAPRGRILSKPAERTMGKEEGKTVQTEKVQFKLGIVLDLSRGNIGVDTGK